MTVAAQKLGVNTGAFKSGCRNAGYESGEWHHTGSHARRTDYYDTVYLAASADFWRGAAADYSPKAAAKLLAKHNVSPLTDAEIAAETAAAVEAALTRISEFLAWFDGPRFVVQKQENYGPDFASRGYKSETKWQAALDYNSAMDMLGVNFDRIHDTQEKAQAWPAGWQERHAKSFPAKPATIALG